MPTIIEQPYPIEFLDQHDTILMRMEEYDTLLVTDPETFTQPVELHRSWVRRPGEQVQPYNCTSVKPRAPQ